jgi:hypothetical protein
MDSSTQQNAALVEQATAAARALSEQASSMMNQIDRYRLGRPAAASADGRPAIARSHALG